MGELDLSLSGRVTLISVLMMSGAATAAPQRTLTLNDVLGMAHVDAVVPGGGGGELAVVIQRPATLGEAYGRTAYEIDPSRDDVWLVSRDGRARDLTNGLASAAGYWCPIWSPDGRRMALLSTAPERGEPRGGDNVRLYVVDHATGPPRRLGSFAMVTQTRYGSSIHQLDLRGGANGGSLAHTCSAGNENAPFLWLDDHRLLALTLLSGQVSGLIDEASRPYTVAATDWRRLRDGRVSTGVAVGSGEATMPLPSENSVMLRIVDADAGRSDVIATIPVDPFRGTLMLRVSPNKSRAVVLAPQSQFGPVAGERASQDRGPAWMVRQKLGIVELDPGAGVRWLTMPTATPLPLNLYGWAPDSRRIAVSARITPSDLRPRLLVVDAKDGGIQLLAGDLRDEQAGATWAHEQPVLWLDARTLLAQRQPEGKTRADWWRVGLDGPATPITGTWAEPPDALRRLSNGRLVGISGTDLVALDPTRATRTPLAQVGLGASFVWPINPAVPSLRVLTATAADDGTQIVRNTDPPLSPPHIVATMPEGAMPLFVDDDALVWRQEGTTGLFLRRTDIATARTTPLLSLDTDLASIEWGNTRLIDYKTSNGKPMRAAVILPPGYRSGRRYPTLVWVYEGYRVSPHGDYFLDPRMPGLYNLRLYAARGYVVLIPSMPLPPNAERRAVYSAVGGGVFPAIDALVAAGIADPDRLGVFGQSYGGYSVYALVTQTNRFKAAVAMAGITDLASMFGQFDPLARGYPGIAHEKGSNWFITDQFGQHRPPLGAALDDYRANSPLSWSDRVATPLLMLHGEDDDRGSQAQAEQFFYSLYSQDKTARLVTYGGESHSLAQSPENIRNALGETLRWFDHYVRDAGQGTR